MSPTFSMHLYMEFTSVSCFSDVSPPSARISTPETEVELLTKEEPCSMGKTWNQDESGRE